MTAKISRKNKTRATGGFVLAEATATTSIFSAVIFCILCLIIQAGMAINIMNGLNQSARQAAREMAMLYSASGGGAAPDASSQQTALTKSMVPGAVNSTSQYSVTWPSTYTKNAHPQMTVTVIATAAPGQAAGNGGIRNLGLPWDSINFFGKKLSLSVLQMKSSATYPLRP